MPLLEQIASSPAAVGINELLTRLRDGLEADLAMYLLDESGYQIGALTRLAVPTSLPD